MENGSVFDRILGVFNEMFGLGRAVAACVVGLITVALALAFFWFFHSAPPNTIVISAGPEGSSFQTTAQKYEAILARNHVNLKILTSQGSLENLKRLSDRSQSVDIGFVQGGETNGINTDHLVSLGSLKYAPILIFYRSTTNIEELSQLAGQRLCIGPVGSGTRLLALSLLAFNEIETNGPTKLLDLDADAAAKALLAGNADAVFLMGDTASAQTFRTLLHTPDIRLYDFVQADGYVRRVNYLNKLTLPQGSIDFGRNIPSHDAALIGPTVELIARDNLNPALSDLLLEAAREIHSPSGLFQRQGDFPAPIEHEFRISQDASRYYKSGKSFLYRTFPFWLASLIDRILVVFLPMIVVVIPGVRSIPAMYRWRVRMRLYHWYRVLLRLEKELFKNPTAERRKELAVRLDEIEAAVNKMRVPASFADQFYGLRGHITFVREQLLAQAQAPVH
jgi:TRAP-type uncharacterized transport system substrate-binding protein